MSRSRRGPTTGSPGGRGRKAWRIVRLTSCRDAEAASKFPSRLLVRREPEAACAGRVASRLASTVDEASCTAEGGHLARFSVGPAPGMGLSRSSRQERCWW
jgi:hypothetical protein